MGNGRVAELYAAHGPAIYLRCRRLLGNDAAAEDATQETFLRVHEHLAKVPDDAKAFTWIYQVATNLCLTLIRDRKPTTEISPDLATVGSERIEDRLLDRDFAARIVARAPEKLRLAAWFHLVEELDYVSVAKILGVSRRTVINRVAAFTANAKKFTGRRS